MLSNLLFLVVENSSCQVHSESKVKALLLFLFFFILKNHQNLSCTLASKGTTPVKINDKMTPEEVAHAKEVRDAEKYAEMKAAFDRGGGQHGEGGAPENCGQGGEHGRRSRRPQVQLHWELSERQVQLQEGVKAMQLPLPQQEELCKCRCVHRLK